MNDAPHLLQPRVTSWRWRLIGQPPLPLIWALPVGEAARAALIDTARRLHGQRRLPNCLHGPADPGERAHLHAYYLAEDADADGYIDHLLVHAPGGLDGAALTLLAAAVRLDLPGYGGWRLYPQWMGASDDGGLFGPARTWVSRSVYFPPWHRADASFPPARQIARELVAAGLPAPRHIEFYGEAILGGIAVLPGDFHAVRERGKRPPRGSQGIFARLIFDTPVAGPLALGFGCHFGLGQFTPEQEL